MCPSLLRRFLQVNKYPITNTRPYSAFFSIPGIKQQKTLDHSQFPNYLSAP